MMMTLIGDGLDWLAYWVCWAYESKITDMMTVLGE